VQQYLHRIEEVSKEYGLSLNKKKCEAIDTNPGKAEDIHFKDGKNNQAKI
jgi:hypothetical protein